jgi:2'-5' RNA ligase
MSQQIRLFIAVHLPESVKEALVTTATEMGHALPDKTVRWAKPAQMHLTLRFLGDTAVAQLPELQTQLTQLTAQYRPFQLQLTEVGAFPNRKRPRVVWAGLAGDLAVLLTMQAALEDQVVALGWSREKRPFSPHITLGRVKDARKAQMLKWDVELPALAVEVGEIYLVQSELRPSGPIYTVRHLAKLEGGV